MNENLQPISRLRRLSVLCLALIFLLFGSGCATISILTEVSRDATGEHADVTIEIAVDPDVALAADVDVEGFAEVPEGLNTNWTYRGDPESATMRFYRHFATLDELSLLPGELKKLSRDHSLDFVSKISVESFPASIEIEEHRFYATIVIPEPEEPEVAERETVCDPNDETLGGFLACTLDYNIDGDPELKAALEKAGDPMLSFDLILPGDINIRSANGKALGERIDEGRVQWQFNLLKPATLDLFARSYRYLSEDPVEALLEAALSDDVGYQGLMGAAKVPIGEQNAAIASSRELTTRMRTLLPLDYPNDAFAQIALPISRAYILANLTNAEGKPVFPAFHTAVPILAVMARNAVDDASARVALGRLVEILISREVERMEQQAGQ